MLFLKDYLPFITTILSLGALAVTIITRFNDMKHLQKSFEDFKKEYQDNREETWVHINSIHKEFESISKEIGYLQGKMNGSK